MTHGLKSWPENFAAALTGRKRFEVRKDDRTPAFAPGDLVLLLEYNPRIDDESRRFTGRRVMFFVGYVERSDALPEGWCAFDLVSPEDLNRVALALAPSMGARR